MESKDANNIPLADILEKYEREVVKAYPGYDMYLSPFRDERTASFKVNTTTNRWQDFAEGTFGTVVDLVMKKEQCSFLEAMKIIEEKKFTMQSVLPEVRERKEEELKRSLHILKVAPLQNKTLIGYAESRGIDVGIAQKYCKEVYYKIGEEGRNCFAVAFENDSGGIEFRNPMFKGCTHPKDITCIDNGSKKCAVFEGFFDMLSYMQLMKNKPELQSVNVVVLNSTAMVSKATEFIQKHEMVHSFLDNDASGRSCFQVIKRMGVEVVNESEYLYPQHNDLNAYLQESIKKKQVNDVLSESPQQKEKEVKSQLKI